MPLDYDPTIDAVIAYQEVSLLKLRELMVGGLSVKCDIGLDK